MMPWKIASLVLPALALACMEAGQTLPARAQSPSFDCGRAETADEQAICADPYLAGLDATYAQAFDEAVSSLGRSAALKVARPALRERRACGGDASCIASVLSRALSEFAAMGAGASLALPKDVGQCARSSISLIEGRLSGDENFESGTAVAFGNGGYQVSYDREEAIIASDVGDPVEICLVKIPENCPPGDDRGRWYRTTNLRSGQSWTLPDAQHECGGA